MKIYVDTLEGCPYLFHMPSNLNEGFCKFKNIIKPCSNNGCGQCNHFKEVGTDIIDELIRKIGDEYNE